ncbi:MAG: type II toxin-antitoxin system HicB family antitoxin [Dehalococcoidia bacterium]|nr:type II toxin-antitoxin system HicB family antitoxin [Dehalococcoidia bacterium]MDZ4279025.1 type II toxin-antitoxin system HicB family antitoxin [Dehalococcoidia bacterium]
MTYAVILTQDEDGNWLASVPAFAGCHTWGRTRDEALAHAREAVEGCIESLTASGDPVPKEAAPPEIRVRSGQRLTRSAGATTLG